MKQFLLFLVAGLAWLNQGTAQQAKAPESMAPTAEENALLWEISGNDLRQPSYLFGTIHMISKNDFFLPEGTRSVFDKSQLVTFEINLEEMNNMAALMPLMMQAFMKGDTSLQDLLSEDDYQVVADHFEQLGLPMMFLDRIKPMFLSALTSEDALNMSRHPGEVVSYEMEFMEMARKSGKTMAGLETAEYQMSMFDSIPYGVQADMLVESIKTGGSDGDQFQQMVDLYKKQDLYGLQEMLASDQEGIAKYEDLLLLQRNRNWIPVMKKMMTDQPTFFAVGAGHLSGEEGVIALLRKQGYTVKPIREENE
jgi:uncharacterized protein YbaP (TraB family)